MNELVRVLELDNSRLRAELRGAADNLADSESELRSAEIELGRLRREIRVLRERLADEREPVRGAMVPNTDWRPSLVPKGASVDWLEREMQRREQEYQKKLRVIAKVQSRPDPQMDTVRVAGPFVSDGVTAKIYDEQGLTEEDKR